MTAPETPGSPSGLLDELLALRFSVRRFAEQPLALEDLERLLWAAQGRLDGGARRTAPSAGSVYPLALSVVARTVEGLDEGGYLHHFGAGLELIESGPAPRERIVAAAIGDQPWLAEAAAIIVVSGDRPGMLEHFADQQDDGRRGDRFLAIETGCAVQNMSLCAGALGLGGVLVGGFDDKDLSGGLGHLQDSGHVPIALFAVGRPHST